MIIEKSYLPMYAWSFHVTQEELSNIENGLYALRSHMGNGPGTGEINSMISIIGSRYKEPKVAIPSPITGHFAHLTVAQRREVQEITQAEILKLEQTRRRISDRNLHKTIEESRRDRATKNLDKSIKDLDETMDDYPI